MHYALCTKLRNQHTYLNIKNLTLWQKSEFITGPQQEHVRTLLTG